MHDQPAPPEQPDETRDQTPGEAPGPETVEAHAEGPARPAAAPPALAAYRPPAPPLAASPAWRPAVGPVGAAPPPWGGASDGETSFDAGYPEQSSRLWAVLFLLFGLKFLVLIFHALILVVLQIGAFFVFLVAQPVVLITGRMPEGLRSFQARVLAQSNKLNAWLYGLTDVLPPFVLSDEPYAAETRIGHPESSSRLWALLNIVWLKPFALLPHLVILYALQIALMVVVFVAQVAILVTGGFPRGMFDFVVGVMRWQTRVNAFLYGLRDEYPPFTLS